jgi:hypothetical protein
MGEWLAFNIVYAEFCCIAVLVTFGRTQSSGGRSVCNKGELPRQWTESVLVPVHKEGDETDCINYSWTSTSYTVSSKVLLSGLSVYRDEIIGDQRRAFRRRQKIFCIPQILLTYLALRRTQE